MNTQICGDSWKGKSLGGVCRDVCDCGEELLGIGRNGSDKLEFSRLTGRSKREDLLGILLGGMGVKFSRIVSPEVQAH